jgi:hypothetical protein
MKAIHSGSILDEVAGAIIVSSGGSRVAGACIAFSLSRQGTPALSISPAQYLATDYPGNSLILVSSNGRHPESLACAAKAVDRRESIILITLNEESPLSTFLASSTKASWKVFADTGSKSNKEFLPLEDTRRLLSLGCRLFGRHVCDIQNEYSLPCSEKSGLENAVKEFSSSKVVVAIPFGEGQFAANALEAMCAESGIIHCMVWDPGDVGHGRYVHLQTFASSISCVVFAPSHLSEKADLFAELLRQVVPCAVVKLSGIGESCSHFKAALTGIECFRCLRSMRENLGERFERSIWGESLYRIGGLWGIAGSGD